MRAGLHWLWTRASARLEPSVCPVLLQLHWHRWEVGAFFLVNPVGIPADLLSSRLSWVSPSSASFDQGWSHTGGYAQWTLWSEQQHPNRRVDVVPLNWSSGSISHDRRWFSSWKATLVPLHVVKCCISIYSQGPGTLSAHNASVSTWVLLRRSQNYTLGK